MENKDDNIIIIAASIVIVLGGAMILYSYRSKIAPIVAKVTSKLPASLSAQLGTSQTAIATPPATTTTSPAPTPTQTPTTTSAPTQQPTQPPSTNSPYIDLRTVITDYPTFKTFIDNLTPISVNPAGHSAKYNYNGYLLGVGFYPSASNPFDTPKDINIEPKTPSVIGYNVYLASHSSTIYQFNVLDKDQWGNISGQTGPVQIDTPLL